MSDIGGLFISFFLFQKKKQSIKNTDTVEEDIIARFVISGNGTKIGETVALHDDLLIVKNSEHFLGIPLKHIEVVGTRVFVKGLMDKDKAIQLGEKWRRSTYKEIQYPDEDSS